MSWTIENDPRQRAVLLLGAPLSGKGTLAKLLVTAYPQYLTHWESSAILKEYARTHDDERADAVREIFSGEKLVSAKLLNDDDLAAIITDYEATHRDPNRTALLDGIIRTVPQAERLTELFNLETTLYLDHSKITDDALAIRVHDRNRPGETLAQAKERIRIYEETGKPLRQWYVDRIKEVDHPCITGLADSCVVRLDASYAIPQVFLDAWKSLRTLGYLDPIGCS